MLTAIDVEGTYFEEGLPRDEVALFDRPLVLSGRCGSERRTPPRDDLRPLHYPLFKGNSGLADISARDRKALVELVQAAQLVDAFGRFPKKQFMERPHDQARVAERVIEMRKRASDISASFRKAHPDAPWDDLEGLGRSPEELWRAAKKVTPKLVAELEPLLSDMPESAFLIAEPSRGTGRFRPKGGAKKGSGRV